ncbi:MAG: penicillin-binding protein 2 [Gammaproteobacteria bacterium]|jgi:penicillin-binding protein 2
MADLLTLTDPAGESRIFTGRALVAFSGMLLLMLMLALRMVQLQVLEHDHYRTISDQNRIHIQPLAPTRGRLFDRNGVLMADNVPVFSVTLVKERVEDLDETLEIIDSLIGLSEREIRVFRERLDERRRPFESVPVRLKLTEEEMAVIAVNRHRLPGVRVEANLVRHYPLGATTASALGSVRRITVEDLRAFDPDDLVDYSATQYMGKLGVEKYYEKILHGAVGHQQVETDARGTIRKVINYSRPTPGQNLTLHLDSRLQVAAVQALEGRRGAVVALEPSTGGVLALVSEPSYDPNTFITGIDAEAFEALRASDDAPLFNRAVDGQYSPGSTFKPFVGLAALSHDVTDWDREIHDPGWFQLPGNSRIYRDWNWHKDRGGGHGEVRLRKAIYRSSNIYFYTIASELGIERLASFVEQFGFGQSWAVDIPDPGVGLLPTPDWKRSVRGLPWYPGDDVNLGIGQGDLLVTPLQMATAVAVIANRGRKVRPRMLLSSDSPLNGLNAAPPLGPVEGLSEEDLEGMIGAMTDVVHRGNRGLDENGTAWAYIGLDAPYRMAGKSGTAQVVEIAQGQEYDEEELEERLRKHAWFIAFAPVDDPKIAVAVLVENGGGGSSVAGPVARRVMDTYLLSEGEGSGLSGGLAGR